MGEMTDETKLRGETGVTVVTEVTEVIGVIGETEVIGETRV